MSEKLAAEIIAASNEEEVLSRRKQKFIKWLSLTKPFLTLKYK